jgi:hypothetical protein
LYLRFSLYLPPSPSLYLRFFCALNIYLYFNDRIASHRRTSHTKNTDYSSSHRRFRRQLMSTVLAVTWFPRPTCSRRASLFSLVE